MLGGNELIAHWLSCSRSLAPRGTAVSPWVGREEDRGGRTNGLTKGFGITLRDGDCLSGILDLTSLISNLRWGRREGWGERETERENEERDREREWGKRQ